METSPFFIVIWISPLSRPIANIQQEWIYIHVQVFLFFIPRFNDFERRILVSPCLSIRLWTEFVYALHPPQNQTDPVHIYASYQPTSEGGSCVSF